MSLEINLVRQTEKYEKVRAILLDPSRKFIIVDGVIGAGKTTLISLVEKYLNKDNTIDSNGNIVNNSIDSDGNIIYKKYVKAIYEPVDLWNSTGALQYFYEDIPKRCLEFQHYTYSTRIASVIDEIYNYPNAHTYILERSIWSDRYIFMELLRDVVGELRMSMYNQWCDMWVYILPLKVNKWILLNTSLDESLNRITMRNRNGESSGISVEYQRDLHKKHTDFYDKLVISGENVMVIESDTMDLNLLNNEGKIAELATKFIE